MKIALIGYGKMGHVIEEAARKEGIAVSSIIDPDAKGAANKEITKEALKDADVCIDFTTPKAAIENLKKIAGLKKNVVMATTGWYDQMEEAEKIVKDSGIGLIWSGNFSIGVNIFFRIIENAAKIIDKVDVYDVSGYEIHHKMKKDSPSGTAQMIGKLLLDNINRKEKLVYDKLDRKIEPNELHMASLRVGSVPGTHVVSFDSNADNIELTHTARTREGFAIGALMAAKWINEKKGFFNINDMMNEILKV